ncbi:MAG: Rha family transcriptional regulator [Plesiomonas shigelloides]
MVLSPAAVVFYIGLEIGNQLINISEHSGKLNAANVLVIAFPCLVIVAQYANPLLNVSQAVLVIMLTGSDFGVNQPNRHFDKAGFIQWNALLNNSGRCHGLFICSVDVKKYIMLGVMSKSTSLTSQSGVNIKQQRAMALDNLTFGRYSSRVVAKSTTGLSLPKVNNEHIRALRGFFVLSALSHLSMVGWAGASKDAPGSLLTGKANPVQFTTSQISLCSGEFKKLNNEAAIMATIPTEVAPAINVVNGYAVTSSLAVADYFSKRHADVIRKIESLECSSEFSQRNFAFAEYTDEQGKKRPAYQITRDGFAFLAMGFTGKRAAQFKEAYITAFSVMESNLQARLLHDELFTTRFNAQALHKNISVIHEEWHKLLRPMLVAVKSPLATTLQDRVNDSLSCAGLVSKALGGAK